MATPSLDRTRTQPVAVVSDPSALVALSVAGSPSCPQLTVTGEVDCSSAPEVRAALDRLVDAEPREIVVDLTGVTFLDSAGLSTLAAVQRRVVAAGGRLRLLAATRAVIRPLQVTGLWDLLGGEEVEALAG